MITRLRACNWKAYSELELAFHQGATFVVARNGVGKTSLVQAMAFGLFGEAGLGYSVDKARRLGTTETWVEVELRLPDQTELRLRRTIISKSGRARVAVDGEHDGVSLSAEGVDALVSEAFGLAVSQLPMLTLFTEGSVMRSVEQPGDFNLVRHLRSMLGVDRADAAAESLVRFASRERRDADALRREQGQTGQLPELSRRKAELERLRTERLREFGDAEMALLAARERYVHAAEWAEHRAKASAWADVHPQLLRRANEARRLVDWSEIGQNPQGGPEGLPSLVQFRKDLAAALEGLLAIRGELAERRAAANALLERLEATRGAAQGSGAKCPVCRRPMSEGDVAHAVKEIEEEAAELRAKIEEAEDRIQTCDAARREIEAVLAEAPPVWHEPGMPDPGVDAEGALEEVEQRSSILDNIRADGIRIKTELAEVQRQLDELAAVSEANAQAVRGYERASLADMPATTLRSMSAAMCARQVDPLARELGKRWENLWPADTGLALNPDGSLALRALGESVSYDHFSGGERTFASVMLRLLSLQALSRARFMILDEPLEHLDARNRRVLAKLFVSAGTSGALDQVVVTTYEESLARALNSKLLGDGRVDVVYVAAADSFGD